MLAALLLFAAPPVPAGAYAMPELCRQLTAATGVTHVTDATLRDYPVFVSVKSGDADRVRKLMAVALHGEWTKDGEKLRLVVTRPEPKEDFAEFERQLKVAVSPNSWLAGVPTEDLYNMAPGEIVRYGSQPNGVVRPMPQKLKDFLRVSQDTAPWGGSIRRMTPGVFELGMTQVEFRSLPKDVRDLLGDDLGKVALTAEQREDLGKRMHDPQKAKLDLRDLSKRDPVASVADIPLGAVASTISKDLVMALPDFTLFSILAALSGAGKVEEVLSGYCQSLNWVVSDGALVGKLTSCENLMRSQCKRSTLGQFLSRIGMAGVANIAILSEYVANQRPPSSNSWSDVMLLALGGVVLDQLYVGDYPFNVRLYTQFTESDRELLRSGKPFGASSLSPAAKRQLYDLLVHARSRVVGSDPGFWPSVVPSDLVITATMKEEQVLLGFTSFVAGVETVARSAHHHDLHKKELGREPLYQPATRVKLQLTISHVLSEQASLAPIHTGFSEISPDAKVKPVEWPKLPPNIAKEFEAGLKQMGGPGGL